MLTFRELYLWIKGLSKPLLWQQTKMQQEVCHQSPGSRWKRKRADYLTFTGVPGVVNGILAGL